MSPVRALLPFSCIMSPLETVDTVVSFFIETERAGSTVHHGAVH